MKSITQVFQNLLKPYIDNHDNAVAENIAPVETDATSASKSYAVGEQLILDGVLYDVTVAITQGDALTVGTNIAVADDVVTQLASVNGALTNSITDITAEIADMNNVYGAKNLLPNNAKSKTESGVTFTVNSDGSITANGTATAQIGYPICITPDFKGIENLFLSGCPTGGGSSTYDLRYSNWSNLSYEDTGEGVAIPTQFDYSTYPNARVEISIKNGATLNNVTFKPMIRLASIADGTYVPYSKTNKELTDDILKSGTYENGTVTPLNGFTLSDVVFVYNEITKIGMLHFNFVVPDTVTTGNWYNVAQISKTVAKNANSFAAIIGNSPIFRDALVTIDKYSAFLTAEDVGKNFRAGQVMLFLN